MTCTYRPPRSHPRNCVRGNQLRRALFAASIRPRLCWQELGSPEKRDSAAWPRYKQSLRLARKCRPGPATNRCGLLLGTDFRQLHSSPPFGALPEILPPAPDSPSSPEYGAQAVWCFGLARGSVQSRPSQLLKKKERWSKQIRQRPGHGCWRETKQQSRRRTPALSAASLWPLWVPTKA